MLLRADLNVPFLKDQPGVIADDGRIRAVLPTIQALRDAGASVVVISHLGRPKGEPDPKYSLKPVSARLAELLGEKVTFSEELTAPALSPARSRCWKTSASIRARRARTRPSGALSPIARRARRRLRR